MAICGSFGTGADGRFECMKNITLKRVIGVLAAVVMMGFGISWLVPCNFGTDGYTAMNLAISSRLGISFGNWQAILNIVLFIIVIAMERENIGIGTVANMLLVGYSCDFFTWIWDMVLPAGLFDSLPVRIAIAVLALFVFVLAAAVYMDMDLGMAPFDALPFIIWHRLNRFSFKTVRIVYDLAAVCLGYLFGAPFAAVTLAMAFLLGPAVEAVGKRLERAAVLRR